MEGRSRPARSDTEAASHKTIGSVGRSVGSAAGEKKETTTGARRNELSSMRQDGMPK